MNPTREAVYAALFNLVNIPSMLVDGGGLFNQIQRWEKTWSDVTSQNMPFLGMAEGKENYVYQHGTARLKYTELEATFYIYINSGSAQPISTTDTPSKVLNNCLDAVEDAIQPPIVPIGGQQTLGGLVAHVWVDGEILKAPGYLDGQGMAIMPIKILVPSS